MVHENHFINALFKQKQNACFWKQHACSNKSLSVDGHLYTICVDMDMDIDMQAQRDTDTDI